MKKIPFAGQNCQRVSNRDICRNKQFAQLPSPTGRWTRWGDIVAWCWPCQRSSSTEDVDEYWIDLQVDAFIVVCFQSEYSGQRAALACSSMAPSYILLEFLISFGLISLLAAAQRSKHHWNSFFYHRNYRSEWPKRVLCDEAFTFGSKSRSWRQLRLINLMNQQTSSFVTSHNNRLKCV